MNSLYDSPLLAMTLLKGVALPKDLSRLPKKMVDNVIEMWFYTAKLRCPYSYPSALFPFYLLNSSLSGQIGQSALQAFNDTEALFESKRKMRREIKKARAEIKMANEEKEKLKKAFTEAEKALKEREELLLKDQTLEQEKGKLVEEKTKAEEEMKQKLEEATDGGFNEAGEHYKWLLPDILAMAQRRWS